MYNTRVSQREIKYCFTDADVSGYQPDTECFVDRLGFIGLIGFINHLVNLISQFIILIKALITPVNLVSSVRFTKTL